MFFMCGRRSPLHHPPSPTLFTPLTRMHLNNQPRRLDAVHFGQHAFQPDVLRVGRGERFAVVVRRQRHDGGHTRYFAHIVQPTPLVGVGGRGGGKVGGGGPVARDGRGGGVGVAGQIVAEALEKLGV